jgi:hypothetical protein
MQIAFGHLTAALKRVNAPNLDRIHVVAHWGRARHMDIPAGNGDRARV